MALQELSTNVIYTMVKQSTSRLTGLRVSILICAALLGVQTTRAQHAFEYAARIGANALLYESDYGKPMPNYNVGMDFSYKYRSPYYIGARVGLGIDVAASTFVAGAKNNVNDGNIQAELTAPDANVNNNLFFPNVPAGAYYDSYVVPPGYDPIDLGQQNVAYSLGSFTETQQLIIASVPVQLGVFIGDFSLFAGVRVGVPVHGMYWQRIKDSELAIFWPQGGVSSYDAPEETKAQVDFVTHPSTVNGIRTMSKGTYPQYNVSMTLMFDVNYSFQIDDKTDFAIGAYLEYDPIGYKPAVTDNTSLMMRNYAIDDHTNEPVFRRDYVSVLEANRSDGATLRKAGDMTGTQVVRGYHRASVGLRLSVSLWSVPLDFGKNYRKQQRFQECMCDFF